MSRTVVLAVLVAAGGVGCSESMTPPTTPTPTTAPATASPAPPVSARYEVVFESTWSPTSHPVDFPSNAHYSGLVGGTHAGQVTFWREGSLASEGIRNMAELGNKTTLIEEVRSAISLGKAESILSGGALGSTPGSVGMDFDVTQDFPLVTLVTMVAPSPDWFVGVSGLPLFENGAWTSVRVVSLLPYDAGTDSGVTYRSADLPTTPRQPIRPIISAPLIYNSAVAPLGTFTFKKIG